MDRCSVGSGVSPPKGEGRRRRRCEWHLGVFTYIIKTIFMKCRSGKVTFFGVTS